MSNAFKNLYFVIAWYLRFMSQYNSNNVEEDQSWEKEKRRMGRYKD